MDWQAKIEAQRAKWRESDRKFWSGMVVMDADNGMDWQLMSTTASQAVDRHFAQRRAIVAAFRIVAIEALHLA